MQKFIAERKNKWGKKGSQEEIGKMLDVNFDILTLCGQILTFFDQITYFQTKEMQSTWASAKIVLRHHKGNS